jgi:predicted  nucleic acid-binding Zn-ribbon protein
MWRQTVKVSVVAVLFAMMGCASDAGRERSGKAVGGLKATRDELAAGRKQIDEVLAALDSLQNAQGDLRPAYNKYKDEVKQTEDKAKDIRARAADMRARADEYQQKWQEEMSKVSNPDLKAAAQARSARIRERYSAIAAAADEVRTAYQPFIKDLKDVQTYLSNDLTPAALSAARPVFDKARSAGQKLQAKADTLATEMNDVAADLSPTAPAK